MDTGYRRIRESSGEKKKRLGHYFWHCLSDHRVSIALSLNTTTNYLQILQLFRTHTWSDQLDYATLRVPVKTWRMLRIICFSEKFWWCCSYSSGFHSSHQAWKFSVAWLLRVGTWESVAVPTLPYRHFSLAWQCVAGLPGVGYCVAHKHCLLIGAWLLSKMKRLLSSILRLPLRRHQTEKVH